jgi:hypothetical protein
MLSHGRDTRAPGNLCVRLCSLLLLMAICNMVVLQELRKEGSRRKVLSGAPVRPGGDNAGTQMWEVV